MGLDYIGDGGVDIESCAPYIDHRALDIGRRISDINHRAFNPEHQHPNSDHSHIKISMLRRLYLMFIYCPQTLCWILVPNLVLKIRMHLSVFLISKNRFSFHSIQTHAIIIRYW